MFKGKRKRGSVLRRYGLLCASVLCSLTLMGCHLYRHTGDFVTLDRVKNPVAARPQTLSVHFLGTGGIYLQGEGVSLLGDPFFTNPLPWHWFSRFAVSSDTKLIDRELKRLPGIADVESILVSHSHYDHALDVSYIAQHTFPLCIYGSETLRNAIGAVAKSRVCSLKDKVTEYDQEKPTWIKAGRRARIAAIRSGHFNHFGSYFYGRGDYTEPPPGGVSRLYEWRVGETYSFVIDILNVPPQSGTAYRLFYMPSAASYPDGNIPVSILKDKKPVDLAIIGASQVGKDKNYPGELLAAIQPRAVMMVHWDSFMDRYKTRKLMNLGVDPALIHDRIKKARLGDDVKIYWPMRGAVHELPLISTQ